MNTNTTDSAPAAPKHDFFGDLARILNAGQARGVVLHGNVHDLFHIEGELAGPLPVQCTVRPAALRVIVPAAPPV